jgi:5-methylcytosine-specific restriction protein B
MWCCGSEFLVGQPHRLPPLSDAVSGALALQFFTALNRKLEAYLDRDHQIGHSYLMNLATIADLRFAWEHKAMPLLQEYFYGDGEKLLAILGPKFVQPESIKLGSGDSSDERIVHRFHPIAGDAEFVQALTELAGS